MSEPVLTVFIPVFNAEAHLAEAVRSVLGQDGPAFELLLIDDGSTDGSVALAQSLAAADPRVRLLLNGANRGVSWTGNRAIAEARGRFLLRLDADDRSRPGRHRRQFEVLSQGRCDVLGSAIHCFGEGLAAQDVALPETDAQIKARFMVCAGNIANPCSAMDLAFVRLHGLRYREDWAVAEDLHFWVDAMVSGARFANLPEVLVDYRLHPAQSSRRGHEALATAQLRVRERLMALWFGGWTAHERHLAARLLGQGSLDAPTLRQALAVLRAMVAQAGASRHGEDRAELARYFNHWVQVWGNALAKAVSQEANT